MYSTIRTRVRVLPVIEYGFGDQGVGEGIAWMGVWGLVGIRWDAMP
jgi:hypothetical protein